MPKTFAENRQVGDRFRVVKPGTQDPLINNDGKAVDGGGWAQPNFAAQKAGDINRYYNGLLGDDDGGDAA